MKIEKLKLWLNNNKIEYLENFDLKFKSWIKAGGNIKLYLNPSNIQKLTKIVKHFRDEKIKYYILGNISNTLIRDGDIYTPIINLQKIKNINLITNSKYLVGAGVSISRFSNFFSKLGYLGVQGLVGIPGSIGGGIYMNASSYNCCISDFLISVTYMDQDANIHIKKKRELNFKWRKSFFHEKNYIILYATFGFGLKEHPSKLIEHIDKIRTHRKFYQENKLPNLGSLFATRDIYKDLSKNSFSLLFLFLINKLITIILQNYFRKSLINYRKILTSTYLRVLKINKDKNFGFSEKTINCLVNLNSQEANKAIEQVKNFQNKIRYSVRREIIILDDIK